MTAPQQPAKYAEETRVVSVSFVNKLEAGEILTGTPQVSSVGDITVGQIWINTEELIINGERVSVGMAVQFMVSGGSPGQGVDFWVLADTTSTPAQSMAARLHLMVI